MHNINKELTLKANELGQTSAKLKEAEESIQRINEKLSNLEKVKIELDSE